ncbi:MAG: hypothetical protein Q9Q13_00510 [Acidobacteriota bacterium]|nr:hypothetical protein [Acidobacteriota bacterium]
MTAWGRPSPKALARKDLQGVRTDACYQLAVEDAAALSDCDVVIFADAAVRGAEPFFLETLEPRPALSFSSHSVEPSALLALGRELFAARPRAWALGIRGYHFNEFGERLSTAAEANLAAALEFFEGWHRAGFLPPCEEGKRADHVGAQGKDSLRG